ncbi:MAG: 5-formyltetrahydrofolate cyclo-ligase [Burkholderiaceae bacterium]
MDTSSGDSPRKSGLIPQADKSSWRRHLVDQRLRMGDHEDRSDWLQRVLRVWLVERSDTVIGAYWPIKGEFDVLPALFRWQEAGREGDALEAPIQRGIGLPVMNPEDKTLKFHAWYPGCPMESDAYSIPKPKGTEILVPTLLFVPCVGYGPGGYRLGYGGGFYDRTLAQLTPRPFTVGLGFANAFLPDLEPEPHDIPLDAILNENGVVWPLVMPSLGERD